MRAVSLSTQGPLWGYLKVNSSETLSSFGDKCPQNGSKNEPGIPPHRAFCGTHGRVRVRAAPHQHIHGCIPGIRGVWVQGVGQTILRLRPTAEKLGLECRETTAYAPAAASHQDIHASLPAIRYHESGFQSRKLRKPGILYTFKLPRREAGPPNHRDDNVDSDQ